MQMEEEVMLFAQIFLNNAKKKEKKTSHMKIVIFFLPSQNGRIDQKSCAM